MSTTYKFFVEAFYAGKWYNIDYLTQGTDGGLNHQYLAKISRSFLGLLEPLIPSGHCLIFEELAESSQTLLLEEKKEEHEDYVRLGKYFVLGDLKTLETTLNSPYMYEGYVTRNDAAQIENGEDEDPFEVLTAHELLGLPEEARREYVLFKWDYPYNTRNQLRRMVEKVHDQLEAFNHSIPYRKDIPVRDLQAYKTRILYYII